MSMPRLSRMTLLLSFIALMCIVTSPVLAEEVITIYNGAGTNSKKHFIDIEAYPIKKGESLAWINDDYAAHWITISAENGTVIADSGPMGIRESFAFAFHESGTYSYYSVPHPEVRGVVIVTDDITTMTADLPNDDLQVRMSWTPSVPEVGQITHFKIIFVDRESGENQKHVDYTLSIFESDGNEMRIESSKHTLFGIDVTRHAFDMIDSHTVQTRVDNIFFVPTAGQEIHFTVVTTPEFSGVAAGLIMATTVALAIFARRILNG